MTELTFTAGERVTLDLRESRGDVRLEDADGPTIVVRTASDGSPFVLRDGDTFRVRLDDGGTIAVPQDLPVEALVPPAVHLRLLRRGETVVTPQGAPGATAGAGAGATGPSGATRDAGASAGRGEGGSPPPVVDLSEFARVMSEQGRRIFAEMTERIRASGGGETSEEVARRLDKAAGRIDEQVQRVAERVEREVERAFGVVDRATRRMDQQARRQAHRVEEQAHRGAERAERAARRAGRGRWWFTEDAEGGPRGPFRAGEPGAPGANGSATSTATRSRVSPEERRVILDMLAQGTISPEQASSLLDALGG